MFTSKSRGKWLLCNYIYYCTVYSVHVLVLVGNSLFGFSSESLVLCEGKSEIKIHSFPRAKSDGSNSLLSIKWGKAIKNCQKQGENNKLYRANRSFFESERAKEQKCDLLSKTSKSLTSLFVKE